MQHILKYFDVFSKFRMTFCVTIILWKITKNCVKKKAHIPKLKYYLHLFWLKIDHCVNTITITLYSFTNQPPKYIKSKPFCSYILLLYCQPLSDGLFFVFSIVGLANGRKIQETIPHPKRVGNRLIDQGMETFG